MKRFTTVILFALFITATAFATPRKMECHKSGYSATLKFDVNIRNNQEAWDLKLATVRHRNGWNRKLLCYSTYYRVPSKKFKFLGECGTQPTYDELNFKLYRKTSPSIRYLAQLTMKQLGVVINMRCR